MHIKSHTHTKVHMHTMPIKSTQTHGWKRHLRSWIGTVLTWLCLLLMVVFTTVSQHCCNCDLFGADAEEFWMCNSSWADPVWLSGIEAQEPFPDHRCVSLARSSSYFMLGDNNETAEAWDWLRENDIHSSTRSQDSRYHRQSHTLPFATVPHCVFCHSPTFYLLPQSHTLPFATVPHFVFCPFATVPHFALCHSPTLCLLPQSHILPFVTVPHFMLCHSPTLCLLPQSHIFPFAAVPHFALCHSPTLYPLPQSHTLLFATVLDCPLPHS